jgi:hypothetical protein
MVEYKGRVVFATGGYGVRRGSWGKERRGNVNVVRGV